MQIVKLGGSVITKKDTAFSPDYSNIYSFAKEISEYIKNHDEKMIIVHGGGSYSHIMAKRYELNSKIEERQKRGVSLTSGSARRLNDIITESLLDYGVGRVFPLQSSAYFFETEDELKVFMQPFKRLLENDFYPILYGDVLLTDMDISSIISSETVICEIAERIKPDRVVIGTNVDGVYNKDPTRCSDAELIERITSENYEEVMENLSEEHSSAEDVTGAMAHKVKMMYEVAKTGAECKIINIKDYSIKEELEEKNVRGTEIVIDHE